VTLLLVLLGGAVGATARYLTDLAVQARFDPVLPWGTFTVNVAGSALLGLLAGLGTALPGWAGALAGIGFCGALTTYSTFGLETVQLARSGALRYALLNVLLTLAAGLGAAVLGDQIGRTM
jgi:fluoride exporter